MARAVTSPKYNYSIIVNLGDGKNFGCTRRCNYCNWQRLKGFGKSKPVIDNPDILKDAKGYVTISGGGDPLWSGNNDEVFDYIPWLIDSIHYNSKNPVRIITREVSNFRRLIEEVKGPIFLSLSYDPIVIREISTPENMALIKQQAKKELIEMTVVSTPAIDINYLQDILNIIVGWQCRHKIFFPITIRENLRSIKYAKKETVRVNLDYLKEALHIDDDNIIIRWLPARVCLEDNVYIVGEQKCFSNRTALFGKEITPDYSEAFNILSNNAHYMIFGSVARYIAVWKYLPTENKSCDCEYNDLDVFVESAYLDNCIRQLNRAGFTIVTKVSEHKIRISSKMDSEFTIDLNIIDTIKTAKTIVSEGALSISRVAICDGDLITFRGFDVTEVLYHRARVLPHRWKFLNVKKRIMSEEKLKNKLMNSHWDIIPMTTFGKIIQSFYNLFKGKRHG